ncbi:exopolyphosphatase [Vibrio sp. CAU 1672]|uniref:exopolyphosphatase n=1 Tax=Vibrio sp. CAU 1672 TaxID=3032594 RepID=UPI0023DA3153|nr:exopolyphosphatase [Vibrio sp. CAU 1672]MDF2155600.1 exopolyphosphatase [Vibrio sp. CAU 1672]
MSQILEQNVRYIAAIDLGSNSFHMVVAKVVGSDLQLVSRHKQRVRLAAGLDNEMNLSHAAMERGLECLAMFAERIQGFEPSNVRIAATHTLRQAKNAHLFIQRAREVLPFPIEIISGEEEARLIYLGVAHTQVESNSKLVVDIGGGSTEMIIGQEFEADLLNSKRMGCVNFTEHYFKNGKLSRKNFNKAILSAEQKLESIAGKYQKKGWDIALGSSGTIKAIREVLLGQGHDDGMITLPRLHQLIETLCALENIDGLELAGLADERKPVFAAGVAILTALFQALNIEQMFFSDGALREGLLYEMEQRFARTDIRMRTTENLALKHHVDLEHAARVKGCARELLQQIHVDLGIKKKSELFVLLEWAALLHEVGLSISFRGFHRHSCYILQHSTLPGFNSEQQLLLATLARFQRKSLRLNELPEFNLYKKSEVLSLIKLLRLAIVLNGQRSDMPQAEVQLTLKNDKWRLSSPDKDWLENNKLLDADLAEEQQRWHNTGWKLELINE